MIYLFRLRIYINSHIRLSETLLGKMCSRTPDIIRGNAVWSIIFLFIYTGSSSCPSKSPRDFGSGEGNNWWGIIIKKNLRHWSSFTKNLGLSVRNVGRHSDALTGDLLCTALLFCVAPCGFINFLFTLRCFARFPVRQRIVLPTLITRVICVQ